MELVIENVRIYDGSGAEPFPGHVLIRNDRIAQVVRKPEACPRSELVLDGEGLSLSPGFIDTHGHSEFTLLADPRAHGKLLQGVTTEINGNCGLSGGPLIGPYAERRRADQEEYSISERWISLREYLLTLESRAPGMNFATLVGHGNIRGAIVAYEDLSPTTSELEQMRQLLNAALREGALGMSSGLVYPPGVYADSTELACLCRDVASHDGIYASHMRSEGDHVTEAVLETIHIGNVTRVRVHISHLKTLGRSNWTKIDSIFEHLDRARENGIRITCDRYPYVASSTDLDSLLPKWVFEGGYMRQRERLMAPAELKRIRHELGPEANQDTFWSEIRVSSVTRDENRWMEGQDILSVSHRLGHDPFSTYVSVILSEGFRAGGIFFGMSEENLSRILSRSETMVGSDAAVRSFDGITCKGKPHPRGFGTFPRYLGLYTRDTALLSTERAIHKVTALPASVFGLKDRGRIAKNAYADLVLFDPDTICDRATYDHPFAPPSGVVHVFVNGRQAVAYGKPTGIRAGRVLRRGET